MNCGNKECNKPLNGNIEIRSHNIAVICNECKAVNIVEVITGSGYAQFVVERVENVKPKTENLELKEDDNAENKGTNSSGKDKKAKS